MLTMTARIEKLAIESFTASVQGLLDDPSDLLHPLRDQEPGEVIAEMRALSGDLDMDFDALCRNLGTPFEQERLRDIENGTIKPAPREVAPSASAEAALYPTKVYWSQEDEGYIAVAPDLPGSSAFGETREEALAQIPHAVTAWLSACRKAGNPVPLPNTGNWEPQQEGLEPVGNETPAFA